MWVRIRLLGVQFSLLLFPPGNYAKAFVLNYSDDAEAEFNV